MSTSDVVISPEFAPSRIGRLLRSELSLVFKRRRNIALLIALACAPLLIGIAVEVAAPSEGGEGPPFLSLIAQNGLFLAFTALVVSLPLFMPLAVSVVSGESVAGEASIGTLRYVLTVPVSRLRLLLVKYAAIAVYALVAALVVAGVGILVGSLLFPIGPVPLLSGDVLPYSTALVRALLVALYVGAMLAGVAAIGLFISTLTEVPLGAMAATAAVCVVAQILDAIPQLSWLHDWLFSHWWLAFGDLLRTPVVYDDVGRGLLTQAAYIVVFFSLAWARFTTRDVTS
ncbi:MAG TPA: ABC transporter permease [Actinomycetes bacterium]|nr:ABC transporter permease [Actinomycetes bacterium]HJY24345.1 ABC transporter permease [Actinomycetes bacterium]